MRGPGPLSLLLSALRCGCCEAGLVQGLLPAELPRQQRCPALHAGESDACGLPPGRSKVGRGSECMDRSPTCPACFVGLGLCAQSMTCSTARKLGIAQAGAAMAKFRQRSHTAAEASQAPEQDPDDTDEDQPRMPAYDLLISGLGRASKRRRLASGAARQAEASHQPAGPAEEQPQAPQLPTAAAEPETQAARPDEVSERHLRRSAPHCAAGAASVPTPPRAGTSPAQVVLAG